MNFIEQCKNHIRSLDFMSGVDRSKERIRQTSEVFTPTNVVNNILDELESLCPRIFKDPLKTFCDPSCGDGQFLSEILIRKLENGIDFETALSTLFGIDLMEDNVKRCRERLLCGHDYQKLKDIVEKNIYHGNALHFDFRFDENSKEHEIKKRICLEFEQQREEQNKQNKINGAVPNSTFSFLYDDGEEEFEKNKQMEGCNKKESFQQKHVKSKKEEINDVNLNTNVNVFL